MFVGTVGGECMWGMSVGMSVGVSVGFSVGFLWDVLWFFCGIENSYWVFP